MTIDAPAAPVPCPSDECLVAILTGAASDDEQQSFDTHLERCDRCLDAVDAVQRRLRIADEIPAAVPAAVCRRAASAAALSPVASSPQRPVMDRPSAPWLATLWPASGWTDGIRARLTALLRPPVMIPAAVGMVAVLAMATYVLQTPGAPRPLTRSVVMPQHVRVTAPAAAVRRQPNGHAEIIATVPRGTPVDISGEERDWLHVTLPNGTEGWVDQEALR